MAINLTALGGLWDTLSGIAQMNGLGGAAEPAPDFAAQSQQQNAAREQAIAMARDTATSEGRQPDLTDYFRAALTLPALEGNARLIANLSGHTLDGFIIRREDLYPTPDQQRQNMSDVQGPSFEPGAHNGIREMRNFLDADGNGTIEPEEISDFYREVQTHMNFTNTRFHNVTFQPATTLEIFNHAAGAQFASCTVDGLCAGETLTIGTEGSERGKARETFANFRVINDQGGRICINSNATINGLTMVNGCTVLEVASGGQLNQLAARDETMSLNVQPQGQLFLPSFENVTFTPDSSMQGAILRGNTMDDRFHGYRNSNLNGLCFDHAALSGISIENCDLTGTSFRHTRLSDVTITDTDLTQADFEGAQIHNLIYQRDGQTWHIDNQQRLQHYIQNGFPEMPPAPAMTADPVAQAVAIGRDSLANAIASIGQPVTTVPINDNAAVRFQQVSTQAGLQGVGPTPMASADAPARMVEGGDIPANATNGERIVATGAAITPMRLAVVDADQNDVSLANQAALQTADAIAAQRTADAMKDYVRGDGRDGGRALA